MDPVVCCPNAMMLLVRMRTSTARIRTLANRREYLAKLRVFIFGASKVKSCFRFEQHIVWIPNEHYPGLPGFVKEKIQSPKEVSSLSSWFPLRPQMRLAGRPGWRRSSLLELG